MVYENNENALDSFIGVIGGISDRLDELKALVDDHFWFHPDEVNWGHVGTAEFYLVKLTELTDTAKAQGWIKSEGLGQQDIEAVHGPGPDGQDRADDEVLQQTL